MSSLERKIVEFPTTRAKYNAGTERDHNVIGQRISEARHEQKLTAKHFSKRLEEYGVYVGIGAIGKWERGESVPNAYQLLAISHALGLRNELAYFTSSESGNTLNNIGKQKLDEYEKLLIASGMFSPEEIQESDDELVFLPKATLRPSAGTGGFLDESGFEPTEFPRGIVPAGADFAMDISGDSMEPVYHNGQTVFVQRCQTLMPGDIGIFMYDGEGYIKQYTEANIGSETGEETGARPVLISFNTKYAPKVVSPYVPFSIFGKVLN